MEEQIGNNPNQPITPKRPQMLTILCILSFIGSGLSGFTFLMVYSAYDEVMPQLQEFSSAFPGMEFITKATQNFFLAGFILYNFSLIGANLMWRLKKVGFHFYTGAQIAILLLPVIFIKDFPFPIIDGLIAALFILLYFRNYQTLS